MTGGSAGGAAQDPEDVFELPDSLVGEVIVRDRPAAEPARRAEPPDVSAVVKNRHTVCARSQQHIDKALAAPESDADLVELMKNADFADLATLTPLGAAVAEAAFTGFWGFGGSNTMDVWVHERGLAFALEAFAEFCHLATLPRSRPALKRSGRAPHLFDRWVSVRDLLERVRAASAPDYAQALRAAARMRENDPSGFRRTLTTFLFPERASWFWADAKAARDGRLPAGALVPSVTTATQAAEVAELFQRAPAWTWRGFTDIEATFVVAAGAEALPVLLAWYDVYQDQTSPGSIAATVRIVDLISRIPRDEALRALVERAADPGVLPQAHEAARRFPHRALRVLGEMAAAAAAPTDRAVVAAPNTSAAPLTSANQAPPNAPAMSAPPTASAASDPSVAEAAHRILTTTIHADPDFARAGLPYLGAAARKRVEAILAQESSADDPALDQLPDLLAAPPWRDRKRKPTKPVVIEGLTPPADTEIAWLPGERERRLAGHGAGWEPKQGWKAFAVHVGGGQTDDQFAAYFAAYAPAELVRPLLGGWMPKLKWADERAHAFVARHEALAIPAVLAIPRRPAERAKLLQPFVNPEIAALMADGMGRLRSVRGLAVAWLRRHPEAAARCLLPTALGKRGKARRNAIAALRVIEATGADLVGIAAQSYGGGVALAVKELMADDGLGGYPRTMPTPPVWARAAVLPPIRVRETGVALPLSATQAVVEMLAISKIDAPYAGLEIVTEFCDAAALGEFAWSLFVNWEQAGNPGREKWALDALALLGDDTVVDRLVPQIRDFVAQNRYSFAYDCLAVLAAIGGDRALSQLHTLAEKGRPNALRKRARQRFEDVAESLDLSPDQLADRVVPDLGLGADGTLRLDYGPRYFDVGFDELLRPMVVDHAGKTVKALPKPGLKDDKDLAEASRKEFTALKKAARTVAADQIKRLEQAMFARRRWQPEDFAAYMVPHPVLRHITRRLVWGVYGGAEGEEHELLGSFRVAEDLSYADVHDAHYALPDGALIGVAHPVDLGTALGEWSEVFADYEILQPFDQLGRPVLELTRAERAARVLDRFDKYSTRAVRIVGLETRGWVRGPVGDGPMWSSILRPLADGRHMVVDLAPGIMAGAVHQSEYQQFMRIWLSVTGENPDFERDSLPLSELDAVAASEILRDLGEVVKQ